MSTYLEKLLHPKWQKKRIKILERDGYKCCMCGDDEMTLHVHHIKYGKWGSDPWDVPDEDLETLCVYCHKTKELCKKLTNSKFGRYEFLYCEKGWVRPDGSRLLYSVFYNGAINDYSVMAELVDTKGNPIDFDFISIGRINDAINQHKNGKN